jgi:hypothetical protein
MSVVNIKDLPTNWHDDPKYVYIGRPGKGLDGPYGNPFVLDIEANRAKVLQLYIEWLWTKLSSASQYDPSDPYNAWNIKQLAFKTLVCFCSPKPCHGDILAYTAFILNEYT